jgi:type I restriction enzyme S subunit
MNAERLLSLYERVAEAPDAIARLRRFVLELAVRGKLGEDPAGKIVTVGNYRKLQNGYAFKSEWFAKTGTRLLRNANIGHGEIRWEDTVFLPEDRASEFERFHLGEGDIVLTLDRPFIVTGTKVARVTKADLPSLLLQRVGRFVKTEEGLSDDYLFLWINSPNFNDQIDPGRSNGVPHISSKQVEAAKIFLPPLAEQYRIVAKVDELMALCDQLETARTARESTRDRLTTASLTRLTAPDTDAETFRSHARFTLDALPALTTHPDQIKTLRQAILNLAVRGKLVGQDPADEPAIRFDRSIPTNLQPPFHIPASWIWSRLSSLGKLKGGGTPSKACDDFWNGSIPWVSPKDMKLDYIAEAQMSITNAAIKGSAVNLIEPESVLFVVRGMILAHSFPVAISRIPLTINQDMKALVLKKPEMAEYLLRALKGLKPEMLARVQRSSHGTCRIEGSDYSDFLVPVPPLAEQRRIVVKVDALMVLCDRLEASLTTADTTRCRLLEALLHEALEPAADVLEAAE